MNRTAGIVLFALGAGGVAAAGYLIYRSRKSARPPLGLREATSKSRRIPRRGRVTEHTIEGMSINQRVALVQGQIEKSLKGTKDDPTLGSRTRKWALGITRHCPARDGECEARAIGDWIHRNIRYTGDIGPIKMSNGKVEGIDVFQTAPATVDFGGGDCDDHAIAVCSGAAANGLDCQLRVTGPVDGDDYEHIYGMIGLPKNNARRYYAVDTTLPNYRFGREVPYGKKKDYPA